MDATTTAPAANVRINSQTTVHAPDADLPRRPACPSARVRGRATFSLTKDPVNCEKCLAR